MKTKITPPAPAPVKAARRSKPAPVAQMSLLTVEEAPVPSPALSPRRKSSPPVVKAETKPAVESKAKAPSLPAARRTKATVNVPVTPPLPDATEETVRVVPPSALGHGAMWRMSGKHGVAYVKDAALAGELLATDAKNLAKAAMAVYYDKKGRAFAWQIRFDTDRWDEVLRRLA